MINFTLWCYQEDYRRLWKQRKQSMEKGRKRRQVHKRYRLLLRESHLKGQVVGQLTSTAWTRLKHTGPPWWHSGWESACQCRGHGFEPWSGKIPHDAEQLGPWATTTEPARLEPVLRNGRGRDSERPAHRDEEWPPLATTRESPRTETKTQHSLK